MRRVLFGLAIFGLSAGATLWARPLNQAFVQPAIEDDGDAVATSQVTLNQTTVTLIDSGTAVTTYNPTLRRRVVKNKSFAGVFVGTNTTTLLTTGFHVDAASGTFNNYITYNAAPLYGMCEAGSCTVTLIKESSTNP